MALLSQIGTLLSSFRTAVLLVTRDLEMWVHPGSEAFNYGIAKDDFKS